MNNDFDDFDEDDTDDEIDVSSNREVSCEGGSVCFKISPEINSFFKSCLSRSKNNLLRVDSIRKFQEGLGDVNLLEAILNNVFVEGVPREVYLVDLSFKNAKNTFIKNIGIRPRVFAGDFIHSLLGAGNSFRFIGHPQGKEFFIHRVMIVSDDEQLDYEAKVSVIPYRTSERIRWNFFDNLIEETQSLVNYTEQKLQSWEEYLDWSQSLAERRLTGCKYYDLYPIQDDRDPDKYLLVFCLIMENQAAFDKIRRYLGKGMMAFNDTYSSDKWTFKFSGKERNLNWNKVNSVSLGSFRKIISQGYLDGRMLKGVDLSDCEFLNPYIVEVAYELEEKDVDNLEDIDNPEDAEAFVLDNVLPKYDSGGFLALSGVKDFALIGRFRNAIKNLKDGEYDSPNIPLWLFDATKARIPKNGAATVIKHWLNPEIESNPNQREAVTKILTAPDLCLIQGPPGTGKTTVIAEAIYQLAVTGKRVLLASQSNDAVDNALERLANNPAVRAIRMENSSKFQRSDKKMRQNEAYESNFTRDNVLKYFYLSLAENVDERWLTKWAELDKRIRDCSNDLRDAKYYEEDISRLNTEISKYVEEIQKAKILCKECQEKIQAAEDYNELLKAERYQCELLKQNLSGTADKDFDINAGKIFVLIESALNPFLEEMHRNGLFVNFTNLNRQITSHDVESRSIRFIIRAFNRLNDIIAKLKNFSVGDGNAIELQNIKTEISILNEDIPDEDDEDGWNTWRKKRNELNKRKRELESTSNSVLDRLPETDKAILSDEIKGAIDNERPRIIALLEKAQQATTAVIKKLSADLNRYFAENLPREISALKSRLKVAEGKLKSLYREYEELSQKHEDKKRTLQKLQEKYHAENGDIETIMQTIEKAQSDAKKILQDDKTLRTDWEATLKEYLARLKDPQSCKEDRNTYLGIFVKACNVVGTSCTAKMKDLDDLGYNNFDVAIIDEVSKATPPELLLPLMRARKTVLVGDHRQLPPMFGESEKSYYDLIKDGDDMPEEMRDLLTQENFDRFKKMVTSSLFKDFFERADESIKHRLEIQYRMHSDIMDVINRFYENRLKSGLSAEQESQARNHGLTLFGNDDLPFVFPRRHAYWFDSTALPDGTKIYESSRGLSTSICNVVEQRIILNLIKKLDEACIAANVHKTLGVISFYQLQINDLRNVIKQMIKSKKLVLSHLSLKISDINTVDRFQGKERNIIIVSLVRNKKSHRLGKHTLAFERINVAFSRAQELLMIVGAAGIFSEQKVQLSNMDTAGTYSIKVYQNIIEELNRNASFVYSGKILSETDVAEIKKEYQRATESRISNAIKAGEVNK